MGNILTTRAHPNQPAITDPGEQSVITDLITPDLCPNIDEFYDELVEHIMDPIDIHETYYIKEVKKIKKADDPTKTNLRTYLDCDKLKKMFPQWPAEITTLCKAWVDVTVRKEEHFVQTEQFTDVKNPLNPDAENLFRMHRICTKFHREEGGFRVEVWMFDHEGKRHASEMLAGFADLLYLKPLLICRYNMKVKVRSGVDMPSSGGVSIVTDAMDKYYTQEKLHEVIVQTMKRECLDTGGEIEYLHGSDDFNLKNRYDIPIPDAAQQSQGGAIAEAAAKGLEAAAAAQGAETPEGGAADGKKVFHLWRYRKVMVDKERCTMVCSEHLQDELVGTRFCLIHTDPVRIEVWQVLPNGERHAGFKEACLLRMLVSHICKESEVEQEAKDLDESQTNFYF